MRCLFSILMVCIGLNLLAQNDDKIEYRTFTSTDFNFTILCPTTWEESKDINEIVPFIFEAPRDNENDFFRENVNAVVEISRGYLLSQYVDALVSRLQSRLANFKLHSRGIADDNPLRPAWIIYDNAKGDLPLKFLSYFYKVGGHVIIVTGSAKIEEFDRYQPIFDTVCNSYKILPPPIETKK
jgi:hypothetical protein